MTASDLPDLVRGVPQGLELGLPNFWYPLIQSAELPEGKPVSLTCLGREMVVYRDAAGRPQALHDRCPHRAVKLSAGRVLDGQLQCAYHGLRFGKGGACELIPWEPEPAPDLLRRLAARDYPCAEAGGLVWVYVGDVSRFPPPDLRESLPEELLDDTRFAHFLVPTEIWDANWLLVIDGSDAYHAATLHMESQQHAEVAAYLAGEGTQEGRSERVPLKDRRVKIVESDGHGLRGVSVDLQGRLLDHGHALKVSGERFNLPGLITNVLQPMSGAQPYVSRLFQVPVDYGHTRLFRYAAWRIDSPADRERLQAHFEKVVKPRQLRTAAEDKALAAVAGDLVEARSNEVLLAPDRDMVRIRRRLAAAFRAQHSEGLRVPADEPTPSRASLVFPV